MMIKKKKRKNKFEGSRAKIECLSGETKVCQLKSGVWSQTQKEASYPEHWIPETEFRYEKKKKKKNLNNDHQERRYT